MGLVLDVQDEAQAFIKASQSAAEFLCNLARAITIHWVQTVPPVLSANPKHSACPRIRRRGLRTGTTEHKIRKLAEDKPKGAVKTKMLHVVWKLDKGILKAESKGIPPSRENQTVITEQKGKGSY